MRITSAVVACICFLANAVASAEDHWVVGLDADMSNVAKAGGRAIEQGIQIALDEINADGGLLGKKVVLEVRDHRGNPARGIANLKAFSKNPNLLAVFGGVHTPVAIAELPFIHEASLVYLDPWAAGTPIIDNGYEPNLAFRLSVRDQWAGKVILEQAKADQCNSVTLLLERTGWGRSNETSMTAAAEQLALKIDDIQWFNWNSEVLNQQVRALATNGTECLVMVANTPEGVEVASTIAELPASQQPKLYSHWGIVGGDFVEQIGLAKLNKISLKYLQTLSFHEPKTARGQQLLARYQSKYGTSQGNNSFNGVAHAYDLMHLLALAVTQAQSNKALKVASALEQLESFNGAMKDYQQPFSKTNHEALNADDYLMLQFDDQGFAR